MVAAVCISKVLGGSMRVREYTQVGKEKPQSIAASQAGWSHRARYIGTVAPQHVYINDSQVCMCESRDSCPGNWALCQHLTCKGPAVTKSKPGGLWTLTTVMQRLLTPKLVQLCLSRYNFQERPAAILKQKTALYLILISTAFLHSYSLIFWTFLSPESSFLTPFNAFSLRFLKPPPLLLFPCQLLKIPLIAISTSSSPTYTSTPDSLASGLFSFIYIYIFFYSIQFWWAVCRIPWTLLLPHLSRPLYSIPSLLTTPSLKLSFSHFPFCLNYSFLVSWGWFLSFTLKVLVCPHTTSLLAVHTLRRLIHAWFQLPLTIKIAKMYWVLPCAKNGVLFHRMPTTTPEADILITHVANQKTEAEED